jgi:hypothetical protein
MISEEAREMFVELAVIFWSAIGVYSAGLIIACS